MLCRSGVRQAVNWGLVWQIVQQIMIDVSGRAVWGAWDQSRSGKRWEVKIEGHQQIFMGKARTKIARCAVVKRKWRMVRPRCELSGVASCQSCIQSKWMQYTNVLCITSVSALPDSRILEDDVHLAAYTAVPWYISAFCWDCTVGTVPHYHSHHPATTDIQINCFCSLDFLSIFVSVCEECSASEEIPVLPGKLTTVDSQISRIPPFRLCLFARRTSLLNSVMIWYKSFLGA